MGSCSSTTIYLYGRNEKYEKNNVCVCVCWRDVLATTSSDQSSIYVHRYIGNIGREGEGYIVTQIGNPATGLNSCATYLIYSCIDEEKEMRMDERCRNFRSVE